MHLLVMNEAEAQGLRDSTAGWDNQLDPRLVEAGEYVGTYVLPARVRNDPHFSWVDLADFDGVEIDTAEAWPITEE